MDEWMRGSIIKASSIPSITTHPDTHDNRFAFISLLVCYWPDVKLNLVQKTNRVEPPIYFMSKVFRGDEASY